MSDVLVNFPCSHDVEGATHVVTVRESVSVSPSTARAPYRVIESRSDLLSRSWEWSSLLDFIDRERNTRFGLSPIPRAKGRSVCNAFITRWGSERAEKIARYAFDNLDGMWLGQMVDIGRFSKGSDPFFAQVIAERLGIAD